MELEAGDDMRALRGFYNQTEGITSTRAICRCKWQNKFYDKCKFWLTTLRVKKPDSRMQETYALTCRTGINIALTETTIPAPQLISTS
jgi:hypothetical protein